MKRIVLVRIARAARLRVRSGPPTDGRTFTYNNGGDGGGGGGRRGPDKWSGSVPPLDNKSVTFAAEVSLQSRETVGLRHTAIGYRLMFHRWPLDPSVSCRLHSAIFQSPPRCCCCRRRRRRRMQQQQHQQQQQRQRAADAANMMTSCRTADYSLERSSIGTAEPLGNTDKLFIMNE